MSDNISEFPGRSKQPKQPKNTFDSEENRANFYSELNDVINKHGKLVSIPVIVTSLESLKIEILTMNGVTKK